MIAATMFENAGRMTLGALAVLGGMALGAVVVGFFCNLVAGFAFGKAMPALPLRWLRILGGISGGLFVGIIVFGGGGFGLGGGGVGPTLREAPAPVRRKFSLSQLP